MQEAIYELGEIILNETSGFTPYIKPLKIINKNGKTLNVMKINFDTINKKISFDTIEEMNQKTAEKYLFFGRYGGPNKLQFYSSSANMSNHLHQTFTGLLEQLEESYLKDTVKKVLEDFYFDTQLKDNRYRYILKIEKLDPNLGKTEDIIKDIKENKDKIKEIEKKVKEFLKNNYNLSLNDFGLYTVYIDGKSVHEYDEYRELVKKVLKINTSEQKKSQKESSNPLQECTFCGIKGQLNYSLKEFSIKYYTTNLKIFASNFQDYEKTLILCPECEKKIIVGQKYLANNLNTYLAQMQLFILPNFLFEKPTDLEDLENFSDNIKESFSLVKSYKNIENARTTLKEIENYYSEKRFFFNMDIIFYKPSNQATKIIKIIKDIDPNIFLLIQNSLEKANNQNSILSNNGYRVSLESLLYLIPVKKVNNTPTNYKYIVNLYEKIFKLVKIDLKELIKNYIKLLGAIQRNRKEYFGSQENASLQSTLIQQIKFYLFLRNLNLIRKEDFMNVKDLNLKNEFKEYLSTMNYDEQKTALFLLGYLMGEIGKQESTRTEDRRKPILNKLSYKGADLSKIRKLSLTIFNKLRQEKILRYNESIYSEFRRLFDKNEENWNLNDYENEFYILSGYAYSNMYKKDEPELENEEGGIENV